MKTYFYLTATCLFLATLQANAHEIRTWTSSVGTTLEAKLVSLSGSSVKLEKMDGSELRVKLHQLSKEDQNYLENLPEEKGNTSIAGISAQPGKISPPITCDRDSDLSYHLYLPSEFHDAREWPVLFVMSPGGGKGGRALQRYIEGAETFGCILALSVESKNGFDKATEPVNAMVADVYGRLPVIKELSFSSGFSGGSRMAYLLAEENRHIKGVVACGSGSGVYLENGNFRAAKLRRSTYVYSLVGSNCFNRTGAYNSHKDFPGEYRLRYFVGKHSWAPASLIREAMARVIGETVKDYRGEDKNDLCARYAKAALQMAEAMESTQPWEAHYLAEFLSKFPAGRDIRNSASSLASRLERDSRVELAIDAEKDINKFGREFFQGVHYKNDKGKNPDRLKEAEKLAEKYASIPHGALIRRLGDGS